MNILVCSTVFHPAVGGLENLTLLLIKEFIRAGHQVKVVTEQVQDPARPLEGVEVIHISEHLRTLRFFLWCDVLYMPNITLKCVWLMAFNPFKKWVISHNGFHMQQSTPLKAALKHFFTARASRSICVSRSVADSIGSPSTVIHNCYDDDVFKLYPDEPRVHDFVFVGRLVTQKGCDLLIDACRGIDRPYTLNIVGEGVELQCLKDRVSAMGLEARVNFMGMMRGERLARFLNRHRVMIVPSRDLEGFGLVALEGMACGCHMVVSDSGGLVEAIGEHGEVFQMGNVQELRKLLESSLNGAGDSTMTRARAAYLSEHSKANVAKKYLEAFN